MFDWSLRKKMTNEILKLCLEKGFLLDKEMLNFFSCLNLQIAKELIIKISNLKFQERVITRTSFIKNSDRLKDFILKFKTDETTKSFFLDIGCTKIEQKEEKVDENYVKILSSPVIGPKKVEVIDFVRHFRARYNQIKSILESKNLENLTSIRKIGTNRDSYTIIGAVLEKRVTKNKNLMLTIEDISGKAIVLVNQNKEELFRQAKDLLEDDIVAFQVTGSSNMLFANNIIYPDAFLPEKKKLDKEILIAFTSDWHIGSSLSLEENLKNFISWINCERGDEKQKDIARKVKYLFLTGDNIDGVGVYPEQSRLLKILDIRDQYKRLAELLNTIRKDIKIIMCPGQHDGVRVAEPQPIVEEDWASELHKIENLTLVPNPAMIEVIGGFKILMYHGASFHSLVDKIDDIRLNYKHNSPVRIVKELLKRRHLSPTHGSVVYIPNEREDPLVITQIPDIIATGDLHRPDIGIYNNIMMIASSCWQSITPFEEKVGNNPDPCKVPVLNLKTREIKILDFSGDNEEKEHAIVHGEKVEDKIDVFDEVYGGEEIKEKVLIDLINSKAVQRLKDVSQYGLPDKYYHKKGYSRFDHSVGVLILLRRLGAKLKEQIAGLLHDVSHTAFSHVIDWVIGDPSKEDFQDKSYGEIIKNSDIPSILSKYGFRFEDILVLDQFKLLEKEAPSLCADRVDYTLRELKKDNINTDLFFKNLVNNAGEIAFNDKEIAKNFALEYLRLQNEHWAGKQAMVRYYILANVLRLALEKKIINMNDIYKSESDILLLLEKSEIPEIVCQLEKLKNSLNINFAEDLNKGVLLKKKFRFIDPEVFNNTKINLVSELFDEYKLLLTNEKNQSNIEKRYIF